MATCRRMWPKEDLGQGGGGGGGAKAYVHVVNNEDGYPCGIISFESRPYSECIAGFTTKTFADILNLDKLAVKFCPSLEYGTYDNPLDQANGYHPVIENVQGYQGGYLTGTTLGNTVRAWLGDTYFHCTTDTVIAI